MVAEAPNKSRMMTYFSLLSTLDVFGTTKAKKAPIRGEGGEKRVKDNQHMQLFAVDSPQVYLLYSHTVIRTLSRLNIRELDKIRQSPVHLLRNFYVITHSTLGKLWRAAAKLLRVKTDLFFLFLKQHFVGFFYDDRTIEGTTLLSNDRLY